MTWIDDNKRPLMAVSAILGVAWFGGRYFDKNQSFNALDMDLDRSDCCEVWVEKLYDDGKIGFGQAGDFLFGIETGDLKCSSLGSPNCSKHDSSAEMFDAERIQYNYTVHREPKGSSKGGWFTSKNAETFEANEICHRSCYDGHEWRLSGTSHLGDYTPDGKPILNWRCDSCGQSKSSPEKPSSKADIHAWEMTRTKNWGDGVFTIYAECKRCGVKGYADGDVEESIDVQHPSLRAETFEAKGDCAECYGTGGLYDSHMGINDECHSCGGTGFDY